MAHIDHRAAAHFAILPFERGGKQGFGGARRAALLSGVALAALTLATPAGANAILCPGNQCVVNTLADTLNAGNNLSLRDAIIHANGNPGTIITFANTLANGTITIGSSGLNELPLILGNNTRIDGGANNITVSGGSTSATTGQRVFFVGSAGQAVNGQAATTVTATIQNLTIANANARGGAGGDGGGGGGGLGGAVFVSSTGALTLSNVALTANAATGGGGGLNAGGGGGGGLGGSGGSFGVDGGGGGGGFGTGAVGGPGGPFGLPLRCY